MKRRILLLTSDKPLAEEFERVCALRQAEVLRAYCAADGPRYWGEGEERLAGVVADSMSLREKERRYLLDLHRPPGTPGLIFLETGQSAHPTREGRRISRLTWPLDPTFLDFAPAMGETPQVFLASPTLYVTGLLEDRLREADMPVRCADNAQTLLQVLARKPPAVIVRWSGNIYEAEEWEHWIRGIQPEAAVYLVDNRGPIHAAETEVKASRPAFLPRKLHELAADILLDRPVVDPLAFGRILIVESFKPALVELTRGLQDDGYDVSACLSSEDALARTGAGAAHVAVIGASLGEGEESGVELSHKLRQLDADLKIILTVDRYPLKAALQGVTRMVEVGLDDCLLKPVEPSRLKFSITRALERRRLLLENTRLLKELKKTHGDLEQLTGFQSKFFAMVAHDVKNPLNAIIGYSDLLEMKLPAPEMLKPIGHIRSASKTLNGIISDLVDFAAIESGKLRVNLEAMNLLEVVSEVTSRVQVAAQKRRITLRMSAPEKLPPLRGDALRTGQVIQNLSTNAIQYTPEGGSVFISVETEGAFVKVSVRDTGIGISEEDLPRIFQRFFQAKNAQAMRGAGFGLGLKIAQEIVKAQGGAMGVDSRLGQGSVFHFTLPIPSSGASF